MNLDAESASFTVALPGALRAWVAEQAEKMGLSSPDNYVLLLLRVEKQRQELATPVSGPPGDG